MPLTHPATPLNVSDEARELAQFARAATHTPGPWRWDGNSLRAVTPAPEISAVHTILHDDGHGCGYLCSNVHETLRELDADRRVIEQAPVMLGLLQELMGTRDTWGNYHVNRDLEARLYAVISDATVAGV
jgi:hypothetical protein